LWSELLEGKNMNLSSLYMVLIIVLAFSIYGGYVQAVSPWLSIILIDSGLSHVQLGYYLMYLSIVTVVVGYIGMALNLVASYYAGKKYVLTKNSALILVLLLIAATWVGRFIGYAIRQVQLPQYPVFNVNFLLQLIDVSLIAWSMVGILAGNYKREADKRISGSL
jgi:hypothetical protein